jgi:hypothetical protein
VLANGLRFEAALLVDAGRLDEGRQLLDEAVSHWEKGSAGALPHRTNRFHLDRARLELRDGRAEAARTALGRIVAPAGLAAGAFHPELVERDVLLSEALHESGEAARALAIADSALRSARARTQRGGYHALEAAAELQWATASMASGRPADAVAGVEAALRWFEAEDAPSSPQRRRGGAAPHPRRRCAACRCHCRSGTLASAPINAVRLVPDLRQATRQQPSCQGHRCHRAGGGNRPPSLARDRWIAGQRYGVPDHSAGRCVADADLVLVDATLTHNRRSASRPLQL